MEIGRLLLRGAMLSGVADGRLVNCTLHSAPPPPGGRYLMMPAFDDPVFGTTIVMVPVPTTASSEEAVRKWAPSFLGAFPKIPGTPLDHVVSALQDRARRLAIDDVKGLPAPTLTQSAFPKLPGLVTEKQLPQRVFPKLPGGMTERPSLPQRAFPKLPGSVIERKLVPWQAFPKVAGKTTPLLPQAAFPKLPGSVIEQEYGTSLGSSARADKDHRGRTQAPAPIVLSTRIIPGRNNIVVTSGFADLVEGLKRGTITVDI